MGDWRKTAGGGDWRTQAAYESHATGGGSPDTAERPRVVEPPAETPIDPHEVALREADEQQRRTQLAASLSHGQSLAAAPEAERKAFLERQNTGAAAEGLSLARGASGPFGAHLDELTGAAKSGSFSGPEYEREKAKAQATIDAATGHAPLGPIIGAMMLPQPASAAGRVALNTGLGASEGVGEAKTLQGAPTEAAKKAAVAAVLSILSEGIAKGAKGSEGAMARGAENQALKAAGLRGGIGSQQAKMGLDDVEAQALGRRFLDEDLIPFGGSKTAVAERAERLRRQAGADIGAQLTVGDVGGRLDYDEFGNAALRPFNEADAVMQGAGGKSLDLVDQLHAQGVMTPGSFSGANRAKSSAWGSARFDEDAPNAAKLYRKTTGAAARNIEDQLRRVDPGAADALAVGNEKYGVAADALTLAKDAARREQANNTLGMTELLAGIGGASLGGAGGSPLAGGTAGLTTALLGGLAKRRGNAAAAVLLDKLTPAGVPLRYAGELVQRTEPALVEESRQGGLLDEYLAFLNEKGRK